MGMLNLDVAPLIKVRNNLGARALGTCAWTPGKTTSTISIQKVVLGDPRTLERVLAHEMAHHATFVEHIKALEGLAREHGQAARPHVNQYLQEMRRERAHGENWLQYVRIINQHMGSDFVTERSDESYERESATKPYYVLIALLPNGKYGFQIGVVLSAKMKLKIEFATQHYGAKLVKTTDQRWQFGPRIGGSNWATSADKQEEMRRLHSS